MMEMLFSFNEFVAIDIINLSFFEYKGQEIEHNKWRSYKTTYGIQKKPASNKWLDPANMYAEVVLLQ